MPADLATPPAPFLEEVSELRALRRPDGAAAGAEDERCGRRFDCLRHAITLCDTAQAVSRTEPHSDAGTTDSASTRRTAPRRRTRPPARPVRTAMTRYSTLPFAITVSPVCQLPSLVSKLAGGVRPGRPLGDPDRRPGRGRRFNWQ